LKQISEAFRGRNGREKVIPGFFTEKASINQSTCNEQHSRNNTVILQKSKSQSDSCAEGKRSVARKGKAILGRNPEKGSKTQGTRVHEEEENKEMFWKKGDGLRCMSVQIPWVSGGSGDWM
jgi:hypothetical protein